METAIVEKTKYFIDLEWYNERGRSFQGVARARFCPSCKAKVNTETQERMPTVDPRTGRVVFEMRTVRFGGSPLSVIKNCCARSRDYITPETPVMEAIFRVFLANGNQPSDMDSIREQLSEYLPLTSKPHEYSVELLEKLICADDYYGLREFHIGGT